MTNKEKYHELCSTEPTIPIFSKDWWLDTVCGEDNWDVVLLEKGGQIVASWPYYLKKKYGCTIISMPKLTQTMGIWIRYPAGQKYATKLGYEKDVFNEMIAQLPNVDHFSQNFHYSVTNWLPFYWQGFQQTTRYTYVIEDLTDLDNVYSNFQSNIKTDIKKAQKSIRCNSDHDIHKFYNINRMTFQRQNMQIPYEAEFLYHLHDKCYANNCQKIFYAYDEHDRIHAAIYLVWDEQSAYYLMGGGHPELRSSGATSLIMWEAIQHAATVTKRFDFEGSMIEPIERFFRAFGAVQTPYNSINRSTKKIRAYMAAKNIARTLLKR